MQVIGCAWVELHLIVSSYAVPEWLEEEAEEVAWHP